MIGAPNGMNASQDDVTSHAEEFAERWSKINIAFGKRNRWVELPA